jgi:pimeloyl-ACP methyl ester carboxylesterase
MAERPASAMPDVPTLIVVGDEDTITPPSDSERMARLAKNARLVRIKGAAHLSNFEQPGAVNDAVRRSGLPGRDS